MANHWSIVLLALCHVMIFNHSQAGTRMLDPPSRASLWRYGYNTPINNFDDQTDCGGYEKRYIKNGGEYGVCGDPSDEPRPRKHEAGGEFAPNPRPVRAFERGSYVTVVMETSSSLFGKFKFRLCNVSDNMITPNQTCFDENLLSIMEAERGTEYQIGSRQGIHVLNVQLPTDMICQHCLLQWTHETGYTTNQDSCQTCPGGETRCHVCKGCGDQVWHVGCTDIAIYEMFQFPPTLPATPRSADLTASTTGTPNLAVTSAQNQCTCPHPDPRDNLINVSTPYPGRVSSSTLSVDRNDLDNVSGVNKSNNEGSNINIANNNSNITINNNNIITSSSNIITNISYSAINNSNNVTNNSGIVTNNNSNYITSVTKSVTNPNTRHTTLKTEHTTLHFGDTTPNIRGTTSDLRLVAAVSTTFKPNTRTRGGLKGSFRFRTPSATTTDSSHQQLLQSSSTTSLMSNSGPSSVLQTNRPRIPEASRTYTNRPHISRPQTNKPHTTRPYTNRPHTNRPHMNRLHTNRPQINRPQTTKAVKASVGTTRRIQAPTSTNIPHGGGRNGAKTRYSGTHITGKDSRYCYVTNRKRYPSVNFDPWCREQCPAVGLVSCFFGTCQPVLCSGGSTSFSDTNLQIYNPNRNTVLNPYSNQLHGRTTNHLFTSVGNIGYYPNTGNHGSGITQLFNNRQIPSVESLPLWSRNLQNYNHMSSYRNQNLFTLPSNNQYLGEAHQTRHRQYSDLTGRNSRHSYTQRYQESGGRLRQHGVESGSHHGSGYSGQNSGNGYFNNTPHNNNNMNWLSMLPLLMAGEVLEL